MLSLAGGFTPELRRARATPVAAALLLASAGPVQADARNDAVNKLFARWDSAETPGANVLVLQDGRELHAASYGMASIELNHRNSADLVYPIGSLSKQFTAYAVHLLVQDRKLGLGDDVRRYIPELHDFGTPITIAMLLAHTSGLRDNINLLVLKGQRIDDVISAQDTFDVILAQRTLNYLPGSRYLYSNANYVLLAKVVEKISGQVFADFLQQRVFALLGLSHSRLVSHPVAPVPGLAAGYGGSTHRPQPRVDSTYGSNGMLTTLRDLGRWSAYFHEGRSTGIFTAMQRTGTLGTGLPITYNSGLHLDERFGGLPYLEHTGAVAGFRSELLIFPRQRLSIVLLANTDQIDVAATAFAIAEIYLKDSFLPAKLPAPTLQQPDGAILQRYVGTYETISGTTRVAPGREYRFLVQGNTLRLADGNVALVAASDREFFSAATGFHVDFRPGPGGSDAPWIAVVHDKSGTDFVARRVMPAAIMPQPEIATSSLAGLYYSDELNTAYRVRLDGEVLFLDMPRGAVALRCEGQNRFAAMGDFDAGTLSGTIGFTQREGVADGFVLTMRGSRVANLRFERLRGPA